MIRHFVIGLVALMFVLPSRTQAQTTTVAGEFSVEPPTLLSLAFDWKITGDDNRNAAVDVSYRKKARRRGRRACRCCVCNMSG